LPQMRQGDVLFATLMRQGEGRLCENYRSIIIRGVGADETLSAGFGVGQGRPPLRFSQQ